MVFENGVKNIQAAKSQAEARITIQEIRNFAF